MTPEESLAARLRKAHIDPDILASLVWSIRPARMMTGDDIEVLADRIAGKFSLLLKEMTHRAAVDAAKENRETVLYELRGLVRIELEQLIAELSGGYKKKGQVENRNGVDSR